MGLQGEEEIRNQKKFVNLFKFNFKGPCATGNGGEWWFPYSGAKNKNIRNLRNLISMCGDTTLTGPYQPSKVLSVCCMVYSVYNLGHDGSVLGL